MPPQLRALRAEAARPLRQQILRPHQKAEELVFPGDDAADTVHYGLYEGDTLVAISSLYREAESGDPRLDAWRLRGVATLPEYRSRGLATQILLACIDHIRAQGGGLLWCNARTSAKPFYDKNGFETVGEPFELPGIGEHYLMRREIRTAD
jgi:predicted GNAT family N-acyltransferase